MFISFSYRREDDDRMINTDAIAFIEKDEDDDWHGT